MGKVNYHNQAMSAAQRAGDACMQCDEPGSPATHEPVGVGEGGVDLWVHRGSCEQKFRAAMGWPE